MSARERDWEKGIWHAVWLIILHYSTLALHFGIVTVFTRKRKCKALQQPTVHLKIS